MSALTPERRDLVDRAHGAIDRSRYHWRTTTGLSKELRVDRGALFEALCAQAEQRPRRIRYHRFPSGRTLEVLWGVVEDVGERDDLPALVRTDHPPEEEELGDPGVPLVFMSHNHRDAVSVVDIEGRLREAGLRPWLYTTDVEHEDVIIDSVRQALDRCRGLLVFVSGRSLGSLWVRKEFALGLREIEEDLQGRTLAVLDADDRALLSHFGLAERGPHASAFEEYCVSKGSDLQVDQDRWLRQARDFRSCLDDYLASGGQFALYSRGGPVALSQPDAISIEDWASRLASDS